MRRTAIDVLLQLDTPSEAFAFSEIFLDFEGLVEAVEVQDRMVDPFAIDMPNALMQVSLQGSWRSYRGYTGGVLFHVE